MSLRCPLCLEPLSGATFYRFCPQHPRSSAQFTVSSEDYGGIYCPEDGCEPRAALLGENAFLLHEDCRCSNPYWDGRALDLQRRMMFKRGNREVTVNHWELGVLKEAAASYPTRREMWFPQILFRAANENYNGRPFGALSLLVGARDCGKTVLSVMAMNRDAFPEFADRRFILDHFVHVTQHPAGMFPEHLLRTMDALDVMKRGRPLADFKASLEILPTNAEDVSNLKSAYFWAAATVPKKAARHSRQRADGTKQSGMGVMDFLGYIGSEFIPRGAPNHRPEHMPTHLVLAMNDTAGERWQRNDPKLFSLRAGADTMAVVLDATALLHCQTLIDPNTQAPVAVQSIESASIAREWLENIAGYRTRCCLIVTKLDLLESDPDARAHLHALRQKQAPPRPARELLVQWLSTTNPSERGIRQQLVNNPTLPVFFVWTEGLNDMGVLPTAYGVEAFVKWCLDLVLDEQKPD